MKDAMLPMSGYLVIQLFVIIIGMNLQKTGERMVTAKLLEAWIYGQMMLFAIFEIIAVPMILLRWSFDALFWSYLVVSLILFCLGLRKSKTAKWSAIKDVRIKLKNQEPLVLILFIIALFLILSQFFIYFTGIHLDEDDARWLAEANDALEYGDLMTRNYSTGEYQGSIVLAKDATSPWPLIFAVLSRVLCGTRIPIVAHTLYASVEIFVMYGIYWLMSRELFQRQESRFIFLIAVVAVNFFNAEKDYTQSVFSLVRIWQGKATVAGVIMPLLIYLFICINERDDESDWKRLFFVDGAACLMSGMGISIAAIVISAYGLFNMIFYKNWKRILVWILCAMPSIVYTLVYFLIKG